MEIKRYQGEVKQVDGEGSGLAVIATLNVIDKDEDVIVPDAFGNQESHIVPAHNWGSVPLGKARIREQGAEAIAELHFNLNSATASEWHSALKFDFENGERPLMEWSFGFDVLKESRGDFEGRDVRFLEQLKVIEVSPVLLGAGENTRTLTLKSRNGGSRKFADQIQLVDEELSDIVARAKSIIDMRKEQGRDLSEDRQKDLEALLEKLDTINGHGAELRKALTADETLRKEMDRYLANREMLRFKGLE